MTRLRQTQDQDNVQTPDSRLISAASVPMAPSWPKRGLIVLGSIPLGLLIGVLAALFERALRISAADIDVAGRAARAFPRDGNLAARQCAACATPFATADFGAGDRLERAAHPGRYSDPISLETGDMILDHPSGPYAHRIAALVRQLKSLDGAAVVAMTAAASGESKSAIGVSLARAAAAMGKKVVLLDCDPCKPPSAP